MRVRAKPKKLLLVPKKRQSPPRMRSHSGLTRFSSLREEFSFPITASEPARSIHNRIRG
ncbi:MAG TPA: hypothetical protein V6D31_02335 [Candidatus Sericytochromatia bacterium]